MKFAKVNNLKKHARDVKSGTLGKDLWFENYEVIAYVGKYRQYWKYINEKPNIPNGYEPESEWHSSWKQSILDSNCEVICGENREHRADIKTNKFVIEIQKSPIDGWAVYERNKFYKNLTNARVIWIVNVEKAWKEKRISTRLVTEERDKRFFVDWKYKWKWVDDIAKTNDTSLFLDFNTKSDNLIHLWGHKGRLYGKWFSKLDFFDKYLHEVAKQDFKNDKLKFLEVFKNL